MQLSNSALYSRIRKISEEDRSPVQQAFFVVMDIDIEVSNGGLEQFFLNSSGVNGPIAEACLREVGAPDHATLARHAFEIVDGNAIDWADHLKRKQAILDIGNDAWERLHRLDGLFLDRYEEIEQILKVFVAAHIAEFTWESPADSWPRLRSLQGTIGVTNGFSGTMATQPDIPPPDTINPVAPPEIPIDPEPSQAPMTEPPGIEPPMPDQDRPEPGIPEIVPPPD
jgi:hypothetical protein